jgi:hypothetical protein
MKSIFCSTVILLVAVLSYGQKSDTIHIDFDKDGYAKIAEDTLTAIYNKQKTLHLPDDAYASYAYNHYRLNDLKLVSIPVFRISFFAFQGYDGSRPLENYIVFEERLKYQNLIVTDKDVQVGFVSIPDLNYEYDRYYADVDFVFDYKDYYADRLKFSTNRYDSELYQRIKKLPGNFYFQLLGFDGFLFDIDAKDHKIYAQYIGVLGMPSDNQTPELSREQDRLLETRAPLNEYVRNNIALAQIQSAALNLYVSDFYLPEIQFKKFNPAMPIPQGKTILVN